MTTERRFLVATNAVLPERFANTGLVPRLTTRVFFDVTLTAFLEATLAASRLTGFACTAGAHRAREKKARASKRSVLFKGHLGSDKKGSMHANRAAITHRP